MSDSVNLTDPLGLWAVAIGLNFGVASFTGFQVNLAVAFNGNRDAGLLGTATTHGGLDVAVALGNGQVGFGPFASSIADPAGWSAGATLDLGPASVGASASISLDRDPQCSDANHDGAPPGLLPQIGYSRFGAGFAAGFAGEIGYTWLLWSTR